MDVEVRLFATLRKGRFSRKRISLPEGSRLADLLSCLKIPQDHVGILLANGRSASLEAALSADDVISIFPSLGGG